MTPSLHNPAILPPGLSPVAPATAPSAPVRGGQTAPNGPAFADVLRERTGSLEFSKHALDRVQRRGIDVDPQTLSRLEAGVARAAGKGARESLVLVDQTAFVVSVANKTVITAVGREHMRDQIFTNIDSAVIA